MAAIAHSRYVPPVPNNLPRSTTTLVRLVQLQEIFNSEYTKHPQRAKAIEAYISKVEALEKKCFKSPNLGTLEEASDSLEWGIADLYQISDQTSIEKVRACAKRMLKDAYSLVVYPVKRSYAGIEGPVFLVEYPREEKSKAYVIKWTHKNECSSTRLYAQLSTFFNHPVNGLGFLVPQSTVFAFSEGFRELPDGQRCGLTREEGGLLQKNFNDLLAQVPYDEARDGDDLSLKGENIPPEERRVVVTERIFGENLLDFSYTKYPHLDRDQKIKLFTRFGRLALLDLVIGNGDRFFRISKRRQEYSFENAAEANLGNVMLVLRSGGEAPIVYAIDNAMDQDLVNDPSVQAKYHEFLARIYSNPSLMIDELSSNMTACMKVLVLPECLIGSSLQNRQKIKECLASFNQDLDELGRVAFAEGIKEMLQCLKGEDGLISLWHGKSGEPLRNYLEKTYPDYLDSLQQRLDIFSV